MQPDPSQPSSQLVATHAEPDAVDAAAAERHERSRRLAQAERDAWQSLRAAQRKEGARTRPGDALDARIGVVDTLRSPRGAAFGARAYHGVPEALDQVPPDTDQTPDEIIAGSAAMVAHLAARLGEANTYWVAPDMVDLVEAAASSMPDQALLATDLPARMGFAWLPFTAGWSGGWGSFRALAWDLDAAGPDQVRVTMFLDRDDWMRHTRESGPLAASRGFALFPDRWHDWTLGRAWESSFVPDEHVPDVGPIHVRPALHWRRRFCQALWALMAEPYVSVGAEHTDRARSRRAQRAGLDGAGEIRVVTLRRPRHEQPSESEQAVEWSHRWIVSGHWPHQWYPSQQQHRLRYILPHVKGPDDKPLAVKETVFALRR